jgi:hypothetical protein
MISGLESFELKSPVTILSDILVETFLIYGNVFKNNCLNKILRDLLQRDVPVTETLLFSFYFDRDMFSTVTVCVLLT